MLGHGMALFTENRREEWIACSVDAALLKFLIFSLPCIPMSQSCHGIIILKGKQFVPNDLKIRSCCDRPKIQLVGKKRYSPLFEQFLMKQPNTCRPPRLPCRLSPDQKQNRKHLKWKLIRNQKISEYLKTLIAILFSSLFSWKRHGAKVIGPRPISQCCFSRETLDLEVVLDTSSRHHQFCAEKKCSITLGMSCDPGWNFEKSDFLITDRLLEEPILIRLD